ncbi:MAG: pyridoxamine 5'-phosphate oxidase family protein [Actinomycetota bacterium]
MSIRVPLEELAAAIAERGAGYLLTAAGSHRPHAMHLTFTVEPAEEEGAGGRVALRALIGRSAAANIGAQPEVTLLWPPSEDGGYSLIVDADARVEGTPDGDQPPTVVAMPIGAVLHRPA